MFGNTQMMGVDMAFPDVCLTPAPPAPPVPLPYPDISAGPMGAPPAAKIMFMCAPSHNMGTTIKPT
ncbi:MAG: PAAR-like domain-containing protein, partial [Polyangiaceae bacterium]